MRTQFLAGSLAVMLGLGMLGLGMLGCGDDDSTDQVCGDDIATGTETCDGPDLMNNDCTTIGMAYTGGILACNSACDGWNVSACTGSGTCGDNTAAGTETCDGPDLRSNDCTSIGQGFTGGTLACNATCTGWDTTGCTGGTCGDDTVGGTELCDGADLDGNDCTTIGMGYASGTLACNTTCDDWDTSGCVMPTCGDDTAEGNEVCDGTDLDSNDCTTIGMGFISGTLDCNSTCDGWNTTDCTAPTCGDDTAEGNEVCDGTDLDGQDCTTVPGGFTAGSLACNGTCDGWDVTACTGGGPVCGDGNVDTGEDCDLTNLDGNDCTTVPGTFTGGTLACTGSCTFNVSSCTTGPICTEYITDGSFEAGSPSTVWSEASTNYGSPLCDYNGCGYGSGTGPIDGLWWAWFGGASSLEEAHLSRNVTIPLGATDLGFMLEVSLCDGPTDFFEVLVDNTQVFVVYGDDPLCGGGYTQQLVDISAYADGGNHTLDLHSITYSANGGTTNIFVDLVQGCPVPASCGDGLILGTEECDGANLDGADCTTLGMGYTGGTLACDSVCVYDESGCTMPICGDNTVTGDEHCDGTDMGAATGEVCTDWGFTGGTITCTSGCLLDFSTCTGGQPGWTCPQSWYNSGLADDCDCGCGVPDPDCTDATVGSCDWCGLFGSCSSAGAGCPGDIDPTNNAQCILTP